MSDNAIDNLVDSVEDHSQGEGGSGDERMDVDSTVTENVKRFRKNSVALVVYPWDTGVVMESDFSTFFNQDHFAFDFSAALDRFDIKLATTPPIHAYVRSAMRDTTSYDRYSHNTAAQIALAESKDLKSSGRASDVCSVLAAYRLLDVIYALDHPDNAIKAPDHHRLEMDFGSFNLSKQVEDWSAVARRFHQRVKTKNNAIKPDDTFDTLASRQLNALIVLDTTSKSNKTLFNLQLAATHIAFMLEHNSNGRDVPDLPCSATSIEGPILMTQFESLLQSLGNAEKFDHLRLPLQMSLILSPIFLLQDTRVHKSQLYCQRYKLMMYGKCLGNARPKSVVRLETVIWNALFGIARGEIDVYAAEKLIANAIPAILENLEDGDEGWFQLVKPARKEKVHLSSFDVNESSVPTHWPMYPRLAPRSTVAPSDPPVVDQEMNNSSGPVQPPPAPQSDGNGDPAPPPQIYTSTDNDSTSKAPPNTDVDMQLDDPHHTSPSPSNNPPHISTRFNARRNYVELGGGASSSEEEQALADPPKQNNSKTSELGGDGSSSEEEEADTEPPKKKNSKTSKSESILRGSTKSLRPNTAIHDARPLTLVYGKRYMKLEIIDLTKIEIQKSPTFNTTNTHPRNKDNKRSLTVVPYTHHEYGPNEPFKFQFLDEMEHSSFVALDRLVSKGFVNGKPRHFSEKENSYFKITPMHQFCAMPTSLIHAYLQNRHIVIPDTKSQWLPFNLKGFRELDSLDALVQIEDQSVPREAPERWVLGTLRQFMENVESRRNKRVLRVVRMPSETSPSRTRFGSEFVAWRETKSLAYCSLEDPSLIKLLAWNDITTEHSTQWWTLAPHGFGLSMNVRTGCLWVVIATPPQDSGEDAAKLVHYFAHPRLFLPSFTRMKLFEHDTPIGVEAILIEEGKQIIIPPNTPYAVFTTADCITMGGYYLSIPNMSSTFYGLIHSFVMGTLVNDGDAFCPALYFRRVIHYLHTSLVVNKIQNSDTGDDYDHLLTFEDVKGADGKIVKTRMRDVESLICLFAIALFMNALDKRTYIPFAQGGATPTSEDRLRQRDVDINSIPHIERRHCCYVRGLAFDLLGWFFNYYKLKGQSIDLSKGDFSLLPVLIAVIARDMVRYKFMAERNGFEGVCSASDFERQIKMSLFAFFGFGEEYKAVEDHEDGNENPNTFRFPSVLEGLDLMVRDEPKDFQPIVDYFNAGQNKADKKYFFAVKDQSDE